MDCGLAVVLFHFSLVNITTDTCGAESRLPLNPLAYHHFPYRVAILGLSHISYQDISRLLYTYTTMIFHRIFHIKPLLYHRYPTMAGAPGASALRLGAAGLGGSRRDGFEAF